MNSSSKLWKWRPTEELSSMAGAASLFLSIREAKVILDSPMWCSSITELRLREAGISCNRLYSLFIEEDDLIFGCKKKLLQALREADADETEKLLCFAVNCGPILVGDDIKGICNASIGDIPVAIADAGGFTGEFDDGYAKSLLAVLKCIKPKFCHKNQNTVNIIGYSPIEHYAQGTLQELERILAKCGIHVAFVTGRMDGSVEDMALIGQAACNIVIHARRGLDTAKWLEETLEQPYIIASLPYGIQGCREWIGKVTEALGLPIPTSIERELEILQKEIFSGRIRILGNNVKIDRWIFCGTYDRIMPIAKAVQKEWGTESVYLNISDKEGAEEGLHWNPQVSMPLLSENGIQILVGTEIDRVILGNINKTIFITIDDVADSIHSSNNTLAGIRGWAFFMEQIFTQYKYYSLTHNIR